ncbi:Glutathione S-transferase Mu 4 [Chamberlinius hualienensis]
MATSTLAYFNIRALAQPVRLLLTYVGEKYEEKIYQAIGVPPNVDKSDWLKEKHSHNLDFPNLPYYIDGKVRLTHSPTILRYLARKYNMGGKTEEEMQRIDLLESELYDLRENFFSLCRSANFDQQKVNYLKNLAPSLKQISSFLGSRKYFAGDNLTYVDFIAYEYLYEHQLLQPGLLNDYQNLANFYNNFEAIPQLSKYIQTAEASKFAANPRFRLPNKN